MRMKDQAVRLPMTTTICNDDMDALANLFVAASDRPAHLSHMKIEDLCAFARVLLVTDGTVTHMLRAHFREPINVEVLSHDLQPLEAAEPWLQAKPGDEILLRKVALIGARTGQTYCLATSRIALERISPDMRADIVSMQRSLGSVLLANFSENRRELLWFGRAQNGESQLEEGHINTQGQPLERAYRVISGGVPIMMISETFAPSILNQ